MADVTAAPDLSSGTLGGIVPSTRFGGMPGSGAPGGSPYFPTTTPQQEQQVIGDVQKAVKEKMGADNALEGQFRRNEDRYHERIAQMEGRQSHELDELNKWDAQGELRKRDVSIWEQFGQPAFVLSMLASAFSAKPMNSALMAGGEAMTALKENRMQDYQRAFDAWKANSDLAIKRFNMEHTMHSEYAEDWSKDMESARIKASAAATRFGDKKMKAFLDAGMYGELLDYKEKEARTLKDMTAAQQQVYEANFKMRWVDAHTQEELQKAGIDPAKMGPEDRKRAQQIQINKMHEYEAMDKPDVRVLLERDSAKIAKDGRSMDDKELLATQSDIAAAKSKGASMDHLVTMKNQENIAAGKPPMTADQEKDFRNTKQHSRNVATRIFDARIEKGGTIEQAEADVARFQYYSRQAQTAGTRSANIDIAVREIEKYKPLALEASKAVPRGEWTTWNELEQNVLQKKSSPEMRRFHDYTQAVKSAAATVLSRGASQTVEARQRTDTLIGTAEGQASYATAIDALETEANIAREAAEYVGTGQSLDQSSPETKKEKAPSEMTDDELRAAHAAKKK